MTTHSSSSIRSSPPSSNPLGPRLAALARGAVLVVLAAAPATAQLTVGPAGSGAQFSEISQAVAAAQPGDTVLVWPGTYAAFVVDRALRVLGAGHEDVIVDQGASVAGVRVVGLVPGEAVQVSGLSIRATWGVSTVFPQVEVAGNAGPVVLSDVHAGTLFRTGRAGYQSDGPTARITDSRAVLLDGCRLEGRNPVNLPGVFEGAESALEVLGSWVWISDSVLSGAPGGYTQSTNLLAHCPGWCIPDSGFGPGAPGLVASDSTLVLARCEVAGGLGGALIDCCDPLNSSTGFPGGPGVQLHGSHLELLGGPGNRVRGGSPTWTHFLFPVLPGPGVVVEGGPASTLGRAPSGRGFGVLGVQPSTVRAAADADVEYGLQVGETGHSGAGTPLGYLVLDGGSVVVEPYALPTADLQPTLAAPGEPVVLSLSGTPAALQLVFGSITLGRPRVLPPSQEALALPLAGRSLLTVLRLDPDGLGSRQIEIPPEISVLGATLVVQALEIGPAGPAPRAAPAAGSLAPRLSNPTTLGIR